MQDRPDTTALLTAVAELLARDVVPAVEDRALSFRVRIAAHLLAGIARERTGEHARDTAHLTTLRALLGDDAPPPSEPDALRQAIARDRARLAAHVRDGDLDDADQARLRAGLREVLAGQIAVGQPRFDLSDRIE